MIFKTVNIEHRNISYSRDWIGRRNKSWVKIGRLGGIWKRSGDCSWSWSIICSRSHSKSRSK
jgi:hypothetical protein